MLAPLSLDMMVPDLLKQHPETRPVLDRYGLHGCGGKHGPQESLGFFARMHGVAESRLLSEIIAVLGTTPDAEDAYQPSVADSIYRRYFLAGIAVILTVGAGWGAWLLWQIGFAGSFTGVSVLDVNAHGHAQIFGWVGLFIMGFAYQAFPRFWHTTLAIPELAVTTFIAMLIGIIVRTTGMTFHTESWALTAAMFGGFLEIAAVFVFLWQLVLTFKRSDATFEPYMLFVFAALAFFLIQGAMSVWHTYNTMTATTRDELVWYVATYQAVLRDVQIHGLAVCMILGVSLRLLPGIFALPEIGRKKCVTAFTLILMAIIGEVVLFLTYRFTHNHVWAAFLLVPWLMLTVGSLIIPIAWKLWRPLPVADRSSKFIRMAFAWLAISMLMLLMLPVYQIVSGIPFSHAYYGSIRHAITVGFISLMIMGVAAKAVPTLNGIDHKTLSALWGPFILVNLGCTLRVSLQTLTDWHPLFFALVGISGLLELSGLAWWGCHLLGLMRQGKRNEQSDEATQASKPQLIQPYHKVADVLAWFPNTARVFDALGFDLLRNPILRRTLARHTTLAQASAIKRVPLDMMLMELRLVSMTIDESHEHTHACSGHCQDCDDHEHD